MPRWMRLVPGQSPVAVVIISISLMISFGFLMTRITKKLRLPNVTAYIISGILIGPFCLNLIPQQIVENMGFLLAEGAISLDDLAQFSDEMIAQAKLWAGIK